MPKQELITKAENDLLKVMGEVQKIYSYLFTLHDNYIACFEEVRNLIEERRRKINYEADVEMHMEKMTPLLRYLYNNCDEKCVLLNKIENIEKKIKIIETKNLLTKPPPIKIKSRLDIPKYCHCEKKSYGSMIQCDNDLCPMEWFHFKCVDVTVKPKGKWYCFNCRAGRPNKMKSRDEILQQLAEYNQMKEVEFCKKDSS